MCITHMFLKVIPWYPGGQDVVLLCSGLTQRRFPGQEHVGFQRPRTGQIYSLWPFSTGI